MHIIFKFKHIHLSFKYSIIFTEGLDLGKENSKRQEIKKLIQDLKKIYPNIDMNIYRSMYNVNLDTLIGYKQNGIRHFYLENYDINNNSNTEN